MIEIEKPRIETAELTEDGKYGKFVVEPLERGFGNTLGNSLRRVLLSSLEGCAVTSIKIDGVLHEFSTIPGVKEDVTEIVLNMKSLVAKLFDTSPKVVEINAEGPCEVTAADVKCDNEVEILNPELHIATLGDGAKLNMEITVDKGRGYVPSERNKQLSGNNVIGVLPIDSIYTPVLKVNYTVDNTRVGQITDYDKLTLDVWTNGVINLDKRRYQRRGGSFAGSQGAHRASQPLCQPLRQGVLRGGHGRKGRQGQGKNPRNDNRRPRFVCSFVQLPQACGYQHG